MVGIMKHDTLLLLTISACFILGACTRVKTPLTPVRVQPVALEDEQLGQGSMTVDEFSAAILQDLSLEDLKSRLGKPFSTPEHDLFFLRDGKALIRKDSISVLRNGDANELLLRKLGRPDARSY